HPQRAARAENAPPPPPAGRDRQRRRHPSRQHLPRQVHPQHHDVVGRKRQARQRQRRPQGEQRLQPAEHEPAPIILLQQRVGDGEEQRQRQEADRRVHPQPPHLPPHSRRRPPQPRT